MSDSLKRKFVALKVYFFKLISNGLEGSVVTPYNVDLFCVNFVFQRILRINHECPFSVHYTSRVSGDVGSIIFEQSDLALLSSFAISGGCYVGVHKGTNLTLKEGVVFAPNICINTADHGLLNRKDYELGSIEIGKNCWLAHGVTITRGVVIGDDVTVAAGAVVTTSVPNRSVVGGVPARVLKKL